ncbi:MAG: sorbitol-6-phosphate 2-dehydrogenase [Burkholderiaceae bacterium]|nr:MAG: sorbitol-6-phosphate 2-dehydrogenase [Burkholderiaceae bacterium]
MSDPASQNQAPLAGKTSAVTGGFGALGRAVGQVLVSAGAQVALLDRGNPPTGLPADALALGGVDLGEPDAANGALAKVAERFGGLDGLVNIAGGFAWEKIEGGSIATWDRLYAMNLRTAVLASQAALPLLLARSGGRIVNIGALAAGQAGAGMGAYAASKAGVARFTEALAEELKDRNITVNALLPSTLDTPANRADMPQADFGRWVAPSALAQVIVFLLSDAASVITGALIPVKGRV